MAYNKTKHLDAAQKYLHQGKIAQAIDEYLQILKHEPKDQITLMTIGDLYVRQGETFQALEYFERLAQIFLSDGFVTKAIAIYKKIAKLAPEEPRPVERLAELYVQQGVLSEARPIYLQLAELHQRAGRQAQAAAMLRKLLEAEPDNLRVQNRLAELSLAMNKPDEAAAAFRASAVLLQNRGDHAEAIQFADRALQIRMQDTATQTLKARSLSAVGKSPEAVALLELVPELEAGGEPADLLLELYLGAGEIERASELAGRLFARNAKHFIAAHRIANVLLETGEPSSALPLLDMVREAMTHAGEQERLGLSLARAAEQLPEKPEPREWLVELFRGTSDSFRLPAALSELAETYQGLDRRDDAKRTMEELLERDPDNDQAHRKYDQLCAQMGLAPTTAPRAAEESPRAKAAPPAPKKVEPQLDPETERFVAQSLTDVDLFSTYGLSQKAIDLLETVLQRVPEHTPTIERLLDLYLGAGDEGRVVDLASQLERLHSERGDTAAADRFTDLRRRFERATATPPEEASTVSSPPEFSVPMLEAEAEPEPEPPLSEPESEPALELLASVTAEADVHEVDLSEEWAALSLELSEAKQAAATEDSIDILAEEPSPDAAEEPPAAIPQTDAAAPAEINVPAGVAEETPSDAEPEYLLELEAAPEGLGSDDLLQELSAEFDAALPSLKGMQTAPPQMTAVREDAARSQAASPSPAEPVEVSVAVPDKIAADSSSDPLREVFNEFRAELGEMSVDNEDLETHYSLGVAYREMGLLEEAISEFQRVAKANDKGTAFRYAMQCCTLLGLAFMEKGQPTIAAMWYERALESPGLDSESILALRYDLGVAQELAGDMTAARKSFSQVYGMNIDYRDVAERLAALGKGN